jgi:hypothetical protein
VHLAQIVIHARGSQIRAGEPVADRILATDESEVFCPVEEDFVAGEQAVHLVHHREEFVDELRHHLGEPGG